MDKEGEKRRKERRRGREGRDGGRGGRGGREGEREGGRKDLSCADIFSSSSCPCRLENLWPNEHHS